MAKKIEVLVVEPGTAPRLAQVEDTMEAFSRIVGGPVETGVFPPLRAMLFYNGEENSREWDNPSRPRAEWGRASLNNVAGTLLLCGWKDSEFTSLSRNQESVFRRWFTGRKVVPHGSRQEA